MKPTEATIRQLLERYYQGTTTRDEERRLKAYFAQDDVPPTLAAEREMFRYLAHEARQTPPLPQGLEERLARHIDRLAAEEPRIGLHLYTQHGAAPQDTFDDPQLAYAEARRALHLFDATFGKGEQQMKEAREAAREVNKKLAKYRIIANP